MSILQRISRFLIPSDEPNHAPHKDRPKEVDEILQEQLEASMREFRRTPRSLFTSAVAAGMEIGFSVLLMGTIYTLFGGELSPASLTLALALCYPLGFIFVIIGRSELFTEHTALAMLPVLNRTVRFIDLLKLWGLIYTGNLIGGYLFSMLLVYIGPKVGFLDVEAFDYLGHHLVDYSWDTILLSALLAGWMMGLLGWLVTSAQETTSRILVVILVTTIIGIAGLHHCIVGSIEAFTAALTSDEVSWMDYVKFQSWATIGNATGGTIFVALLKFSYAKHQYNTEKDRRKAEE